MIDIFFALVLIIFLSLTLTTISRAVLQGSAIKESLAGVRHKTEDLEQRTQIARQELQKLEFELELGQAERRAIQLQEENMKKLADAHAKRAAKGQKPQ